VGGGGNPCDDDSWGGIKKKAKIAAFIDPGDYKGDDYGAEYYLDSAIREIRPVNTSPLQWMDPTNTSTFWPSPPIMGTALSLEAYMGVQDGARWGFSGSDQFGPTFTPYYFGMTAVYDQDAFGFDGLVLGSRNYFGKQGYTADGPRMDGFYEPDGLLNRNPRLPPCRFEFPSDENKQGTGTSLRHIYEPHFISTPYPSGLAFNREGLACSHKSEDHSVHSEVGIGNHQQAGDGFYSPTLDRYSYTNARAARRDFGVSHTMKIPTGGMGGNPFWLLPTSQWSDVLASLHFDFMPFQVPHTVTRPITYRFWDTLYSTALFGGPSFSIVLDDYGIFDEEFYRMVIRHHSQNEMQIHQWRAEQGYAFDERAGHPRNYVNPHALYEAMKATVVANANPLPDISVPFSMHGWVGPCADLCFSPIDGKYDDKGVAGADVVAADQVALVGVWPYKSNTERLSMAEKRKCHQESNFLTNPNAVQDYYYTFLLGPSVQAMAAGQDLFEFADALEAELAVTPEMLSHRFAGQRGNDTPFVYGKRIRDLMAAGIENKETVVDLSGLFDDNVAPNNSAVAGLYPAITGTASRFVVDKLTGVQQWAWEKMVAYAQAKALKMTTEVLGPLLEARFPKLLEAIKTTLNAMFDDAKGASPFGANLGAWGETMAGKIKGLPGAVFGSDGVKDELQDFLKKTAKSAFSKKPISGAAGDVEMDTMRDFSKGNVPTSMPPDIADDTMINGPVADGAAEVEDVAASAAEGAEVAAEAAVEAGEAVAAVAGESLLAEVAGPLVIALAISLALDAWEKAAEEASKAQAAAAAAAIEWKHWDSMLIKFDESYLTTFNEGANLSVLTGSGDSDAAINAMYTVDNNGANLRDLAMMEGITTDDFDMDAVSALNTDQWHGGINFWSKCADLADTAGRTRGTLGWIDVHTRCLIAAGYKPTPARYFNWDPTKMTPDGKTIAFLGGDLRTVANLIGMNHLSLSCIDSAFMSDDEETDPMKIRAKEMLQMAEVIRTMRVVDHYMRGSQWTLPSGEIDADGANWKPFPPMYGLAVTLLKDHMTPIPVMTVSDTGSASLDALIRGYKAPTGTDYQEGLFAAIEGRDPAHSDLSAAWASRVKEVEGRWGVAPRYVSTEVTYTDTISADMIDIFGKFSREIPVPIFAPHRSPTMFVSSLDPNMAWPTKAIGGIVMESAFDETKYFQDNNICLTPDSSSTENPLVTLSDWFSTRPGVSCKPTFGDAGRSRFVLRLDPSDTPGWYLHNEATVEVMLVNVTRMRNQAPAEDPRLSIYLSGITAENANDRVYTIAYAFQNDTTFAQAAWQRITDLRWSKVLTVLQLVGEWSGGVAAPPNIDKTTPADLGDLPGLSGITLSNAPDKIFNLGIQWGFDKATAQAAWQEVSDIQDVLPDAPRFAQVWRIYTRWSFLTEKRMAVPANSRVSLDHMTGWGDVYFVMMASMYPGEATEHTNRLVAWGEDWTENLTKEYRSLKFIQDLGTVGGGKLGGGTITVLDYKQTFANVVLFEERMHSRVESVMKASPSCYEALLYFWQEDYPTLKTLPGAKLDDICAWLLEVIPEPVKPDGYLVVSPQKANVQVMIHVLASKHFATDKTTLVLKKAEWNATIGETPSADQTAPFKRVHDCTPPGGPGLQPGTKPGQISEHPKTTPEGGLTFLHQLTLNPDPSGDAAVQATFGFEPETTVVQAHLSQAVLLRTNLIAYETNQATIPLVNQGLSDADDIINNMKDQYDAAANFKSLPNTLPRTMLAQLGRIFAQCEIVRVARIAACLKLQAGVDEGIALDVIDAVEALPPTEGVTASLTKTLRMFFDVRKNPGVIYESQTSFLQYADDHKLLAEVCKLTYKADAERYDLIHPGTKQPACYIKEDDTPTHELHSSPEIVTYFMAGTRTLIVAFTGTDFEKDITSMFPETHKPSFFQKIAAVLTPYSDLASDLQILTGKQGGSDRFAKSEAYVKMINDRYSSCKVILTGHSLGGAIATHCLQYMVSLNYPSLVTAVVFNPGRGMDDTYFDDVLREIGSPNTKAWYTRLTTYRVGGESSWPIDDDPVSTLSGGLGTTHIIEGPGVPKRLKAHSSDNWITTAVLPYTGTRIMPTPG
jgi:hypothetical protein